MESHTETQVYSWNEVDNQRLVLIDIEITIKHCLANKSFTYEGKRLDYSLPTRSQSQSSSFRHTWALDWCTTAFSTKNQCYKACYRTSTPSIA